MASFLRPRVIPCLLLRNSGLVKTRQFKDPVYLGDPRNIVKIFNDKEVDELVLLDISATLENRSPRFDLIGEIVSECFAPLGYGGGIRTLDDVKKIIDIGVEKVVINTAAHEDAGIVSDAAAVLGSQSVVVSIDVRRSSSSKYEVYTHSGTKNTRQHPALVARKMVNAGAGEILLNSIDRDGMTSGYDIPLIKAVAEAVSVPVVACGGARGVSDLALAVKQGGASAAAAGSLFVFHGKLRGVLISFPTGKELDEAFGIQRGSNG